MNKLLEESLEKVKAAWETNLDGNTSTISRDRLKQYRTGNLRTADSDVARLRLDWECSTTVISPETKNLTGPAIDLLLQQVGYDLDDLIENGNVNSSDWLLKTFNGSKIRDKRPVEVDVFETHIYREYKENKKTIEFTVYLLMYVRWDNDSQRLQELSSSRTV